MTRDQAAGGLVVAAVMAELSAALRAVECPGEVAVQGGDGPLGEVVLVVSLALGDAARVALGLREWKAAAGG